MKTLRAITRWIPLLLIAGLFMAAGSALAQSGGDFDLSWWTIDGGSHTVSSGGSYTLGGIVGQADVGILSGGSYILAGGFWHAIADQPASTPTPTPPATHSIYLPVVVK